LRPREYSVPPCPYISTYTAISPDDADIDILVRVQQSRP
jgi:hypothetical protein